MSACRDLRKLAGKRPHLLDRMAGPLGMDRKVVQGQAGDSAEAEGENRQMGRLAGSDSMDSVHRGCHSHRIGILQDTPGVDDGTSADRQICEIPRLESYLRSILIPDLQKSKNRYIFATGIEILCNGSTTDFGSVCPGSNPGISTKAKSRSDDRLLTYLYEQYC